jgi:hypothetical protein
MKHLFLFITIFSVSGFANDLATTTDGQMVYIFDNNTWVYLEEASEDICPYIFASKPWVDYDEDGYTSSDEFYGQKTDWYMGADQQITFATHWYNLAGSSFEIMVFPPNGNVFIAGSGTIGSDNQWIWKDYDHVYDLQQYGGLGEWYHVWIVDYTYYVMDKFTIHP